jgi:hypothetical protein
MRYHFSETLGKSVRCDAREGHCPLVHGDSADAAKQNHESMMAHSMIPTLKKSRNHPHSSISASAEELRARSAQVLRETPLKKLDAAQLAQTLRHEAALLGLNAEIVDSSVDLATILHAHQIRGNRGNFATTPYIEHPLRNAVRLIRLGAQDQDVIVAAVLHDTIEDGARVFMDKFHKVTDCDELTARNTLRQHINDAYGPRVLHLVDAVTNDYIADQDKSRMSTEVKNKRYHDHVAKAIENHPGVFLVKVSDFIDNATGLYNNDIPERRHKTKKQAIKYLPVVEVFKHSMMKLNLPISERGKAVIWKQLCNTTSRLQNIINKYSN